MLYKACERITFLSPPLKNLVILTSILYPNQKTVAIPADVGLICLGIKSTLRIGEDLLSPHHMCPSNLIRKEIAIFILIV